MSQPSRVLQPHRLVCSANLRKSLALALPSGAGSERSLQEGGERADQGASRVVSPLSQSVVSPRSSLMRLFSPLPFESSLPFIFLLPSYSSLHCLVSYFDLSPCLHRACHQSVCAPCTQAPSAATSCARVFSSAHSLFLALHIASPQGFTGVDAPYEAPLKPEIWLKNQAKQ